MLFSTFDSVIANDEYDNNDGNGKCYMHFPKNPTYPHLPRQSFSTFTADARQPWTNSRDCYSEYLFIQFEYLIIHFDYLIIPFDYLIIV